MAVVANPRFQVAGTEEAAQQLNRWATKLREPAPAFNDMMDYLATEQRDWFQSKGGGTWPQLSEPYKSWRRQRFPKRGILHGPDTRGHRGLQLRDQLTKRPFGFEVINDRGFTFGSTLPYAPHHQTGAGRLPKRPPLKPLNPQMLSMLERILKNHVVGETIERNMR